MRPKILIVLGVLFAAVSMQAARSTALKFSVVCNAPDSCTVTGSGLGANASYQLGVSDSCGTFMFGSAVNANSTGALSITVTPGESAGCDVKGWTFTLSTIGRRSTQVATFFASDPD
jgi:hypothetical protein